MGRSNLLHANKEDAFHTQWDQKELQSLCEKIQWMLRFKRRYKKFTRIESALVREIAKRFLAPTEVNPLARKRVRNKKLVRFKLQAKSQTRAPSSRGASKECPPKVERFSAPTSLSRARSNALIGNLRSMDGLDPIAEYLPELSKNRVGNIELR